MSKVDGRTFNRKGLKKGRSIGEVKQLLDQAKLDGNKMQVKIWQSVLDKLNNDKKIIPTEHEGFILDIV